MKIAEKSEIRVGKMKKFVTQGKEILIANVNGSFYAISNVCTHATGRSLTRYIRRNYSDLPKAQIKI